MQAHQCDRETIKGAGPAVGRGIRATPRQCLATLLDGVIALYSLVLVTIALTGGVRLGAVSLTDAAKPLLILALVIPIRVSLDERSWSFEQVRALLRFLRAAARDRVPQALADVAFAVVVTRAATVFIAFMADLLFTPYRTRAFDMPFERVRLAGLFAGWDSGWYFDIASRGYYFRADGQSSVAFFPLYPMLVRAAAWPFGGSDRAVWIAAIVVSVTAFVLALLALHRLTERLVGSREAARRAVLYTALFPFSFFLTRVYAESMFLLTSVLAVGSAYGGRWWRAGAWGALATLARPNGILIGVPLLLLALGRPASPRVLATRAAALAVPPLALAAYSLYVHTLAGDPLAWLSAQAHWGYSLGHPPWEQLLKMLSRLVKYGLHDYFLVSSMAPFRLFHGVAALFFLALTPAIVKRLGVAMGAYVLVSLLVPLSGNALEGVGRYAAVLFPAFMLLGSFSSPRVHEAILIVFSLFLALFVSLFSTGRQIY